MPNLVARLILVPLGVILGAATAVAIFAIGLIAQGQFARLVERAAAVFVVMVARLFGGVDPVLYSDEIVHYWAMAAVGIAGPMAFVALVGEIAGLSGVMLYVAGAGLAYAALPLLSMASLQSAGQIAPGFAASGFCAGFIYWLIAGRSAARP